MAQGSKKDSALDVGTKRPWDDVTARVLAGMVKEKKSPIDIAFLTRRDPDDVFAMTQIAKWALNEVEEARERREASMVENLEVTARGPMEEKQPEESRATGAGATSTRVITVDTVESEERLGKEEEEEEELERKLERKGKEKDEPRRKRGRPRLEKLVKDVLGQKEEKETAEEPDTFLVLPDTPGRSESTKKGLQRVLFNLKSGMSVAEAARESQVKPAVIYYWRKHDPTFAAQMGTLRIEGGTKMGSERKPSAKYVKKHRGAKPPRTSPEAELRKRLAEAAIKMMEYEKQIKELEKGNVLLRKYADDVCAQRDDSERKAGDLEKVWKRATEDVQELLELSEKRKDEVEKLTKELKSLQELKEQLRAAFKAVGDFVLRQGVSALVGPDEHGVLAEIIGQLVGLDGAKTEPEKVAVSGRILKREKFVGEVSGGQTPAATLIRMQTARV